MLNIDKVATKAGVELIPGKDCPPPKGRGARAWSRLIGWIRRMETAQAEREIETAREMTKLAQTNAELANENRELIKKLAAAAEQLSGYLTQERLAEAGIPEADRKYLATGYKAA